VSSVALRHRLDPALVAEPLARTPGVSRVETRGPGLLVVHLAVPGMIAVGIARDEGYGAGAEVDADLPQWPRTFDNRGFRIRFAHERAAAVERRAVDLRVPPGEPGLLTEARELRLLGALAAFPGHRKPVLQLERIADGFHDVYEYCPALPQGDQEPTGLHGARVILAKAVRVTLSNGLRRLGENARERT
ncbi:MAG: DALR anticodon-binding domain-containing protein, partial [Streptosporangiaceae bacterium]